MAEYCDIDTALRTARTYRTAARLHRVNMLLCSNWVDRLCEQLSAEYLECRARELDESVAEYEGRRVELLARGAVLAEVAA